MTTADWLRLHFHEHLARPEGSNMRLILLIVILVLVFGGAGDTTLIRITARPVSAARSH
jgi:hypothetical protein